MRNRWKVIVASMALFGVGLALNPQPLQARPEYMEVFKAVYPDYVYSTNKCGVCHAGNDKKTRNDYGKAVEEALGAKKVKDVEAIKAALKKCDDKLPRKKP